jgi:hypothetical protein
MWSNAVVFVAGALVLAGGWFARDMLHTDSVGLGEPSSENASLRRVDAHSAQLDRIEALLNRTPQPVVGTAAARELDQSGDFGALADRIASLESKVTEVLGKVNQVSASLEELSLAQPTPSQAGINRLFDAVAKDSSLMQRPTTGMTYRDATLSFGTPTVKRSREGARQASSGLPVSEWLWEVPESGRVLLIQFAGGTAFWAVFTSHASLDDK